MCEAAPPKTLKWWVRVETFVEGDSAGRVGPAAAALREVLRSADQLHDRGPGADQGTGMAEPVIGLSFVVAAHGPGAAADLAVDLCRAALGNESRGLYGVSVVSYDAAPADPEPDFPSLND